MKWPEIEIEKVAEVASGFGFPRELQGTTGEEFPFFKVGDMNLPGNERCMTTVVNTISAETLKKLKAKTFPKGTTIFPKIGAAIATNKKRMLVQPSVVDNNVMGLIPTALINEWYLYYWMQQYDLRSISNIGPVPSIRKTELEKVFVPLPPLSEQRRIVEILGQADELRKKRAEADAIAARIPPTLFYKMFGDPAANPFGWAFKALSDAGAVVRYGLGQPPAAMSQGVPLIRATNISAGRILSEDMIYVDPNEVPSGRNAFLRADEVLVVRSGAYTGDIAQVTEKWAGAVAGYDLVVSPGENLVGGFLEAYLLSPFIQKSYFRNLKARAGQPHLNAEQVSDTPVPIVPIEKQRRFAASVNLTRQVHEQCDESERRLSKLFDVMLHQAFSDEI